MKYQATTYSIEIRGVRAIAREIYLRELPPTPITFPVVDKADPLFGLTGPSFVRGGVTCVFNGPVAVADTDEDRAAFEAEVFEALNKINSEIWDRMKAQMAPRYQFRLMSESIARAKAARDAAPTVGRCGHRITLIRDLEPDVTLRCTKTPHALDMKHAVTDENGEAIIWWPYPSGGFLLRGVVE